MRLIGEWTCMQSHVLFFMKQNKETEDVRPKHGRGESVVCLAENKKGRKKRGKKALPVWWHMGQMKASSLQNDVRNISEMPPPLWGMTATPTFRATVPVQALDSVDICISGITESKTKDAWKPATVVVRRGICKCGGWRSRTFWKGAMSVLILPIKHEQGRVVHVPCKRTLGKIYL